MINIIVSISGKKELEGLYLDNVVLAMQTFAKNFNGYPKYMVVFDKRCRKAKITCSCDNEPCIGKENTCSEWKE